MQILRDKTVRFFSAIIQTRWLIPVRRAPVDSRRVPDDNPAKDVRPDRS